MVPSYRCPIRLLLPSDHANGHARALPPHHPVPLLLTTPCVCHVAGAAAGGAKAALSKTMDKFVRDVGRCVKNELEDEIKAGVKRSQIAAEQKVKEKGTAGLTTMLRKIDRVEKDFRKTHGSSLEKHADALEGLGYSTVARRCDDQCLR